MTILPYLGYSAAEIRDVVNTVRSGYRARPRVQLLNLDGDHLGDISGYLADGQVDGDISQPVNRTASVTFTDPKRRLPFDADDASDVALDQRRMLRILWEMWIDSWQDWASIPVFTGPVMGMQRDGDQVSVNCDDKARFGLGSCWKPLHLDKGMKKTDAIVRILTERCGALARELDIADEDAKLPDHRSLHRQSTPFLVARRIADGMDRQLFYDGDGMCRKRHHPSQSRFSFTGHGHVTSPIQVSYTGDVVNAVEVKGAQPHGPKSQVAAEAVADANHKFSPDKMGRHNTPRFLASFIDDSSIKHHAEAQRRADRELADGLSQSVDVSFSCVPVPFLNLGDMCHVDTDDGDVTFRLKTFSLPLLAGSGDEGTSMTVGTKKRLQRAHPRQQGQRHHARRNRHADA